MVLSTEPAKPMMDENTRIILNLTDTSGKPVSDAKVTASLTMPLMDMGKNEVRFANSGAGTYTGTVRFTMSGPWTVEVTAIAGNRSAQRTFDLVVGAKD